MMVTQNGQDSLRLKAKIGGVLYLIVILSAGFAEAFARGRLIVRNDPSATAANILTHETFYRLGGAADLVNIVCDVALALIFYELFRHVSKSLALLSTIFKLIGDILLAAVTLTHFAPLVLLKNAQYLNGFSTPQLQAQALAFLRLHSQGYNIAMVFFGVHCVLLGYLVFRATFYSRILGELLAVAGVCYVTNSFARFIDPTFAAHLSPYILWPGILAEAWMALSLLFGKVNIERESARASQVALGHA